MIGASIGLSLDLALKSGAVFSYIKTGRVLDLTSPFTSASTTVADRSPEGNNATLYSGRYASTDGVAGKLFYSTPDVSGIDLTGVGVVSQITFKGRAATGTVFTFNLASGVTVTSTQVGNNVWEDHSITVASVTANDFYAYTSGASADWSDVIVKAATASPRYQLNESRDASLDGYPAIDSSGNGYHGTHSSGVAGGAGEGTDSAVVGAAFAANEDKLFFDGVDDYVEIATTAADFTAVSISEWVYLVPTTGSYITFSLGHQASDGIEINYLGATGEFAFVADDGTRFSNNHTAAIGTRQHLVLTHDGTNMNAYLNGVRVVTDAASAFNFATATATASRIGTRWDSITATVKGSVYDVKLYNRVLTPAEVSSIYAGSSVTSGLVHSYEGYGNTDADWLDTIGSNNGTVNGSPVTVGQKRATILQTAGMDWNKYRTLSNGANTGYATATPQFPQGQLYLKLTSGTGFYAMPIPAGLSGQSVVFKGSVSIVSGSPSFSLRNNTGASSTQSNIETVSSSGSFTITLTASAAFSYLTISEADVPSEYTFTNLRIEYVGNNFLIPESDSTAGQDALGNAIAIPRPTSDTFNGFSSTEYLALPDNASLETVRSITVAIYNDGTTRDFVQAAGGASFVHSAANVLTTDQTGTHAYYVNGVATTTLAAGWNIVGITFDAGKDLSGGKLLFQNAKLLAYDPTALTADQQLQNFNVFKSKFGL